jgi:hypothetical protein
MTRRDEAFFIIGAIVGAIMMLGITSARSSEIHDIFGKISDRHVVTCQGARWQNDTSRGSGSGLAISGHVRNSAAIDCGANVVCEINECFFLGTLVIMDNGRVQWFDAPRSSYPDNWTVFGGWIYIR